MNLLRRVPLLLCLLALVTLNGCYSFSATSLPAHIHSVVILDPENLTTDPALGLRLRDGILEMFRLNASAIRVVQENGDSDFQIRLTGYNNAPENFTRDASVETYKVTVTVDVTFRDLVKNTTIYEGRGLRADGVYDISKNETEDKHGQQRAIAALQQLIINNALARW